MSNGVTIKINVGNLSKTVNDMGAYGNKLEEAFREGIIEFGDRLNDKIHQNMIAYGVPESVTSTVRLKPSGRGIEIHVAGELVEFFEYGTGILGSSSPHPAPFTPWIYDVNGHGDKGWWYPTTDSDPNRYKWTDSMGQLRAWTRGKIARPFIYDSFIWGRSAISSIVRKHINRIKM